MHFRQGYVSEEKDKTKRPYATAYVQSLYAEKWEQLISRVLRQGYYEAINAFEAAKEKREELDFYATINQNNPLSATQDTDSGSREQATSHDNRNANTEPAPSPSASATETQQSAPIPRQHPKMLS